MSMKTLSLYLLALMASIAYGCQKDIPTEEDQKKESKISKTIYLPIQIDQVPLTGGRTIKYYLEYENDEGDLKKVTTVPRTYDYIYSYTNGKLSGTQVSWDHHQSTLGDSFATYTYSNNKIVGSISKQWEGRPKPGAEPDQNGNYQDTDLIWELVTNDVSSFTWKSNRIIKRKSTRDCFNYEYDEFNMLLSHMFDGYNPTYTDFHYFHNDKNHWMKDIKNQFFIAGSLPFGGVFQKDLTKMQQLNLLGGATVPVEYSYFMESKYNEDSYPTEIIVSSGYGGETPAPYAKYLITYKKVVLNN